MNLEIIKPKNSLKNFQTESLLIQDIVLKIKQIPSFNELKNNVDLVEHILQLIVNNVSPKLKINVMDVAIKIISSLFTLDSNEIKVLEKLIDYLIERKIIKKKGNLKYIWSNVKWFIKKKVLGV
jgi:hypothetical protein